MTRPSEWEELRERIARLTARVYALEKLLGQVPATMPGSDPAPVAAVPVVAASEPPPEIRWPEPKPAAEPPLLVSDSPHEEESLELRVGKRWFSYLGVVAVVLGLAVLLRLAIINDWIGLTERVVAGVLLGYALAGAGERLYRRGYLNSGYALSTIGTAAAYLSLWAGNLLYYVVTPWVALVGMGVVTAYNAWVALRKNSQIYAFLALLGAFLVPVLLGSHENHEVALFSYLLMLDAAIATLAAFRTWVWPLPAGLTATLALAAGWAFRFYTFYALAPTSAFIVAFLALFCVGTRFSRELRLGDAEPTPPWLMSTAMPLATAASAYLSLVFVIFGVPGDSAWFWRSAALLALGFVGLHLAPMSADHDGQQAWRWTQFVLAAGLATIALTLKFSGRELTAAWLVEGGVLAAAATGSRDRTLLRWAALILLGLGAAATVMNNAYTGVDILWNPRFGMYALAFAVIAATAALAFRRARGQDAAAGVNVTWGRMALLLAVIVALLPLFAGWFELQTYWWGGTQDRYFLAAVLAQLRFGSQLSYSLWCMLYAAALLGIGSWRRWGPMRWLALAMLALAIVKVLLYDLSRLALAYRVVSLLVLGVLLLVISYLYQRGAITRREED